MKSRAYVSGMQPSQNLARWALLLSAIGACTPASAQRPAMNDTTRDQNKKNVRTLYEECMNPGNWALLEQLIAPDYAGPQGEKGPNAFKSVIMGLKSAFPDIHYTVEDIVAEGDSVAIRWHWSGTHRAPFRGFAPTQKSFTNTGAAIFHLRDGKIVASTIETDRLGFLQQLGIVPPDTVLLTPPAR
jgi:steroid delta-isomerase-like uncharacterized protein